MIFYGPLPFINIAVNWIYVCFFVSLGCFGIAFGVISSFARIQEASEKLNYIQDTDTYLRLSR